MDTLYSDQMSPEEKPGVLPPLREVFRPGQLIKRGPQFSQGPSISAQAPHPALDIKGEEASAFLSHEPLL